MYVTYLSSQTAGIQTQLMGHSLLSPTLSLSWRKIGTIKIVGAFYDLKTAVEFSI